MRSTFITGLALLATLVIVKPACADETSSAGLYGGISLGGTRFEGSDQDGSAFKLFAGYQFNENLGAEVGYVRLADDESETQIAGARAFYAAGTVSWPLGARFLVNGRLGLASSHVTGDGNTQSAMVGFGAQYRFSPRLALTVNVDHFDKVSQSMSSDVATVGAVFRF